MPSDGEIKAKFWKHLKSDMTIMLGVEGSGEAQPMTAQLDGDKKSGPIWFFKSKDTDLVAQIGQGAPGASKGHDLFAGVTGELSLSTDRATVDRLWIRFEPHHAHIWLNENSLFSSVKLLLGSDPKKDYMGKVADMPLS